MLFNHSMNGLIFSFVKFYLHGFALDGSSQFWNLFFSEFHNSFEA